MKRSVTHSLLIAFGSAVIFALLNLSGLFTAVENRVCDSFLRFRPKRERFNSIVFLEVDDDATALLGVFPWPRSVMADGLFRLKEYGVSHAIFDIEYIDKSPPGVDAVYLERGLPGDFSQSFSEINANMRDMFSALAEGRLSRTDAAHAIEELSGFIGREENTLLEKARGIARNNDEYLARSFALFGRGWATLNLQTRSLTGEQGQRREQAEKKFSYPVDAATGLGADRSDSGERYADILPPIFPVMETAKGAGFTNSFVDKDGVRRRIFLTRNIQGYWYLQLAFAPLVEYLGNPRLVLEPGSLTLKGASIPGTSGTIPKDITIPLDSQGAMLLDWPLTGYRDSFTHLSFAELVFLETDESLMEQYLSNLAAMDMAFFSQFDEDISAAYTMLYDIHSLLSNADHARSRALAETPESGEEAFAEYIKLRNETRSLIRRLSAPGIREKLTSLAEALALEYPDDATLILDEVSYIKTNLEYLQTILPEIEEREMRIKNILAGKICILGRVDTGSTDFGVNPFWEKYENPGSHAVVIDTILSGAFITPLAPIWSTAAGLVLVPLIIMLLCPLKPAFRSLLGLGGAALIVFLSFALFVFTGIFTGLLCPVLSMILAVIGREIYAYIGSEHEKQFIRSAFSTYVSTDVVDEIIADPSRLQLGGVKRHMSAIFTDIQGFSTISERLDPEHLVSLLNRYLTAMSDVVLAEKGTIDKYEGDAIIAFFGAPLDLPDHALRACVSAITMKRIEKELNRVIAEEKLSPVPLLTRIGINSGSMVAGNMGTKNKMNYTIMGNTVNLAARLEGVNKQYGTWILASEATVKETGDSLLVRRLDRVRVVGINEPVRICELLELSDNAPPELREQTELFHEALSLFEQRDWNTAARIFGKILDHYPDDRPSLLYLKRCQEYLQTPPEDDWDGVYNLSEK
jgi:adenylate cyclase